MSNPKTTPENDRPLRVMFLLTSMPVGGAETLLVNLIERLDTNRFAPEVCCLKERGPLGEELAKTIPVHFGMTRGKYDVAVLKKLVRLMEDRQIDAVITVGCGDKMFWGRLAARRAKVPVIACALHSTGWPDGVGHLNRWLTGITDAFIGVAKSHGQYLIDGEKFPMEKVHVIPNGIDTERFQPSTDKPALRKELGLPLEGPLVTIVAALRPEKNHRRFLDTAESVRHACPQAKFIIVGDGPERAGLEECVEELKLNDRVVFLGNRSDIPQILAASDVFMLTSDNEAAPVSIMEAMSCGLPVISSNVGSVHEMVLEGQTGFLCQLDASEFANRLTRLFGDHFLAEQMGQAGRKQVMAHGSVEVMVKGYEDLIATIYHQKLPADHSVGSNRVRQIDLDSSLVNIVAQSESVAADPMDSSAE